jgi:hypothetical protein
MLVDETASFAPSNIDSIPGNGTNGQHCLIFVQSKDICAVSSQRSLVEPKTWLFVQSRDSLGRACVDV